MARGQGGRKEEEREPAVIAPAGGPDDILLERDVDAIEIPGGHPITLPAGARLRVTQALGGSYTVLVDDWFLARLEDADAADLGLPPAAAAAAPLDAPLEEQVWAQLRTCYDPEIPANIVDLGLIYGCRVVSLADGRSRVEVSLTLTAPGCGMGDVLCDDIRRKLRSLPGVAEAEVEVVLDPPWDPGRMSEAARLQLGLL